MHLQEIATIAGKSGLFRITKPTRAGVILESLDAQKTKTVAGPSSRVSILKEISIYTSTAEGSVALELVLMSIYEKYSGQPLALGSKSTNQELWDFALGVLPDCDTNRVYVSDLKKLANWYNILVQNAPSLFEKKEETTPASA